MLIIVIGYKDQHGAAEPVYVGNCGVAAAKAVDAAASRYIKFGKIQNPLITPVAHPTPGAPIVPAAPPIDKKPKK